MLPSTPAGKAIATSTPEVQHQSAVQGTGTAAAEQASPQRATSIEAADPRTVPLEGRSEATRAGNPRANAVADKAESHLIAALNWSPGFLDLETRLQLSLTSKTLNRHHAEHESNPILKAVLVARADLHDAKDRQSRAPAAERTAMDEHVNQAQDRLDAAEVRAKECLSRIRHAAFVVNELVGQVSHAKRPGDEAGLLRVMSLYFGRFGKLQQAIECLELSMKCSTTAPSVGQYRLLADLLLRSGKPLQALGLLQTLERTLPEQAKQLGVPIADALNALGQHEEALKVLGTSEGDIHRGQISRAIALHHLGRTDECEAALNALATQPLRQAESFFGMGRQEDGLRCVSEWLGQNSAARLGPLMESPHTSNPSVRLAIFSAAGGSMDDFSDREMGHYAIKLPDLPQVRPTIFPTAAEAAKLNAQGAGG